MLRQGQGKQRSGRTVWEVEVMVECAVVEGYSTAYVDGKIRVL